MHQTICMSCYVCNQSLYGRNSNQSQVEVSRNLNNRGQIGLVLKLVKLSLPKDIIVPLSSSSSSSSFFFIFFSCTQQPSTPLSAFAFSSASAPYSRAPRRLFSPHKHFIVLHPIETRALLPSVIARQKKKFSLPVCSQMFLCSSPDLLLHALSLSFMQS
jgi:hypothetical protein